MARSHVLVSLCLALSSVACGGESDPSDTGTDAAVDAGADDGGLSDRGVQDVGVVDLGIDAGIDDLGPDGGDDAGSNDGSTDGGSNDTGSFDMGSLDVGPGDTGPGDTGATDASTTLDWRNVTPTSGIGPGLRSLASAAWDPVRQTVQIYGGFCAPCDNVDWHWEWDGTEFTLMTPASGPAPTTPDGRIAFDTNRNLLVLQQESTTTWEWHPTAETWRSFDIAPERFQFETVFDVSRGRTVLYGGGNELLTRLNTDTHHYDGTSWIMTASITPGGRMCHSMTYDSDRDVTVLFGGHTSLLGSCGVFLADALDETWERNTFGWIQRMSATKPSPRSKPALAYDSDRQVVVLYGGWSGTAALDDTWEWNGASWRQLTTMNTPPGLTAGAMAYDPTRQRMVLIGGGSLSQPNGTNEVWELGAF